jgi:signal transduction histidine kinase
MHAQDTFASRFWAWAGPKLQKPFSSIFRSIKGQIFIVFAATFLSVCIITGVNFWSLAGIKERLLLGERYDDLLNNILELRRFEKNYLFYGDLASLREGEEYLRMIDSMIEELSGDIRRVTDQENLQFFQDIVNDYDRALKTYEQNGRSVSAREEIRQRGKALVDAAEQLLQTKRAKIHKAIARTFVLPFAFLAVFFVLMLFIIALISHGLLKPLQVLRSVLPRMAKGDYSQILYKGLHTDEMSDLFSAFNRMSRELEMNQEDLLQARKIAALGTFTAGIAHEINNPINNVYLCAQAMMEDYLEALPPDGRELVHDILSQAERAGEIVRNLLDFSRTERPVFSSLNPLEVIQSTVKLLRNQIMLAGVKLNLEIPTHLAQVNGNLRNLQQVFMNLLLNAIQAMPGGGAITVRATDELPDLVRIDVEDNGKGIDEDVLQHIFEPFFTTKEVGRGTGLGLAVVYSIVKRHGGRLEVKSEVGKGSAFSVFLLKAGSERPIGS